MMTGNEGVIAETKSLRRVGLGSKAPKGDWNFAHCNPRKGYGFDPSCEGMMVEW
jgi:hypothetical protein